jgi:hypothetical protein
MARNFCIPYQRYCLMTTDVGRHWYHSIRKDKLSYRQVSFYHFKWTPSREEHKTVSTSSVHLSQSQLVGSEKLLKKT